MADYLPRTACAAPVDNPEKSKNLPLFPGGAPGVFSSLFVLLAQLAWHA